MSSLKWDQGSRSFAAHTYPIPGVGGTTAEGEGNWECKVLETESSYSPPLLPRPLLNSGRMGWVG